MTPAECERTAHVLAYWLAEQIWRLDDLELDGQTYTVLGCSDLDSIDEGAVVLRAADGMVLDVDLQVTVTPHQSTAEPDGVAGQEPLPLGGTP